VGEEPGVPWCAGFRRSRVLSRRATMRVAKKGRPASFFIVWLVMLESATFADSPL
jgi:hypothetical protein